jgi:hypothetical protein
MSPPYSGEFVMQEVKKIPRGDLSKEQWEALKRNVLTTTCRIPVSQLSYV